MRTPILITFHIRPYRKVSENLRPHVSAVRTCELDRVLGDMGLRSRQKGKRGEREVVALARRYGLEAERTWQTAQASDPKLRASDVRVAGRPYQVKRVKYGFRQLYRELEHVAGLFLRADGQPWLVVLRADDFLRLLGERRARETDGGL